MAAPEGSVSIMSESLGGTSNTQLNSASGDVYPRYVICIDYGTTYTGAAWILAQGPNSKFSDIRIVQNWVGGLGAKVPSVLTYSASSSQKWGYDIGDSVYAIRWTKLRLEVPKRVDALKSMKHTLQEADMLNFGPGKPQSDIPRHLIKTSADIVLDYLKEVLHQVRVDIENVRDRTQLEQFPLDVVITHPAVWDDRGKNLIFRAVTSAFWAAFGDVKVRLGCLRLASEPEACAQYTVQAARAQQTVSEHQLRVGECFIVVDAGGGTVDLVSYRIDQLSPFKIAKVTAVSGGSFGATKIDNCFLQEFLPNRLSPACYTKLLNMGGARERYGRANHTVLKRGEQIMLERFEVIKREFEGREPGPAGQQPQYFILDLPPDIGAMDDPSRGIVGGQLFISGEDMEEMFKECVGGIKQLIEEQLLQVVTKRRTVRTIFLSGGFSHSEYLKKCVNDLARSWRFELLRSDECWTAVARGGVLLGLGLNCKVPPPVVQMPYSLGLVTSKRFALYDHKPQQRYEDSLDGVERARDHVEWFAFKGDLIRHDKPTEKTIRLVRKLTPLSPRAGRITIIISATDDDLQHVNLGDISPGEVSMDFDLSTIPPDVHQRVAQTVTNRGKEYEIIQLQLDVSINQERADIGLMCGKTTDGTGRMGVNGFHLGNCDPFSLKWVELMNMSTSEWNIGPLPPNVVAIPGPLNASSDSFPPGSLVIENASHASAGSIETEKVIFGATSGLVISWAACWLVWHWKKGTLLSPRGSRLASPDLGRTVYLDGGETAAAADGSTLELGAMGDGFIQARKFEAELEAYYENVRTELEMYEKKLDADDVEPEDVEAGTELLRRRYETQLGIYGVQNSHEVTREQRNQRAVESDALLADFRKLVVSWNGQQSIARWSPEELDELRQLKALLGTTSENQYG
ncbi:hypothetical protein B0T26DRAFT_680119 [Lasiosphaeria miniovina]|uniref:Uncharacterized protein n=1 Tax=Lasiosphaeria miniovina TaxID=1954250 RepID=A0AA40DM91_9PEZI|nr:uncharacterized protein B0T26DRAFT_680119 [Lasiosphaeria miniovina]KAK0706431.1 hypothetical protein B0T26DRAFT_680119 [Lasiosphaeria miniovina]